MSRGDARRSYYRLSLLRLLVGGCLASANERRGSSSAQQQHAKELYQAVLGSRLTDSEALLHAGAAPDGFLGEYGETALIQAAGMGHRSLVRSLLE